MILSPSYKTSYTLLSSLRTTYYGHEILSYDRHTRRGHTHILLTTDIVLILLLTTEIA